MSSAMAGKANASTLEEVQSIGSPARSRIWIPRAASVIGAVYFLAHSLSVILGPEQKVMEWLYDDAFYYLITAKHFSERHLSSFDGITLTSGYHPLWMWLCSIVYGLHGALDITYVRWCMGLALAITSSVLLLALRDAWVNRRAGMLWALALGASSYSALNNGLTTMEWSLVLLSWFLMHVLVTSPARRSAMQLMPIFLVGIAGSLSRSDFGLVPASYFAAAILLGLRSGTWNTARRAAAGLAGSIAGMPVIFLYNHSMTGSWLQGSARVKGLAASLASPFDVGPALWQFTRVLLYLPPLDIDPSIRAHLLHLAARVLGGVAVLAATWLLLSKVPLLAILQRCCLPQSLDDSVLTASLLGVGGYLLLDGFNSLATYGWYSAVVTGFLLLLSARLLQKLRVYVAAAIVVPLMLANMATAFLCGGNAKSQMQEVYVGKAMHADHPGALLAGGDVGKPSFYNNGTMVNLDGLMNNEVIPYLATGRIHCYVLRRHLEYLSGIGSIVQSVSDAERVRHGESPIPWTKYFTPVDAPPAYGRNESTVPVLYFKTNFAAIRASGECLREE